MKNRSVPTAVYDRPVKAKLVVRLDDGEEWDATYDDLKNEFRLESPSVCYWRFSDSLTKLLDEAGLLDRKDITSAHLNVIRYLAETAIVNPDLLDHPDADWSDVAGIERVLQERFGGRREP